MAFSRLKIMGSVAITLYKANKTQQYYLLNNKINFLSNIIFDTLATLKQNSTDNTILYIGQFTCCGPVQRTSARETGRGRRLPPPTHATATQGRSTDIIRTRSSTSFHVPSHNKCFTTKEQF